MLTPELLTRSRVCLRPAASDWPVRARVLQGVDLEARLQRVEDKLDRLKDVDAKLDKLLAALGKTATESV